MPSSSPFRGLAPLAATLALPALIALPPAARADVRVTSSDARGVTLELSVPAWSLSAPGPDGRVRVIGVPGAHSLAEPGRALLPAWAATIALPPLARPSVRVLSSAPESAREGVRLAIAGKPVFRNDDRLGPQPAMDPVAPIADGAWPTSPVQMTRPWTVRGRRMVSLELRPFRYDEGAGRLSATAALVVRVDFGVAAGAAAAAPAAGDDPAFDAAFAHAVANWSQAKGWRESPESALPRRAPSLFAARPAGAAAIGFDEDQPEVRVQLDSTAIYFLPYDQLAAAGYPANVPVAEVSVHRHEFLEGQTPAYGTIELPCEVWDANGNGVFDSGDGVLLWSRTWSERTGATNIRRFWGDYEIVYVTRKLSGGLRFPTRAGWRGQAALTPPPSYPWFRHVEHDFAPFMSFVTVPTDTNVALWHWTSFSLYYQRPDTLQLETNDLDNTRPIVVRANWVGRKSNGHFIWAGVRNASNQFTSVADSAFWFGILPFTATATLPGTALSEGRTNFWRMWGHADGPPNPSTNNICNAGLDWIELTYWRRYRAIHDALDFNSADASGEVQIHADGFLSPDLHVLDVTDPDQPVEIQLDPAHVSAGATVAFDFQDSVASGAPHRYAAVCLQNPEDPTRGPLVPPAASFSAVQRANLAEAPAGDYLLVVPQAFQAAAQPLVDLRASQNLQVLVAPLESVDDEFDGGRRTGTAIQRFARYAYAHWNTRFLTLFGDGTLDPLDKQLTSGLDRVPVMPTPGPVPIVDGYEIIPSDNRYAFITNSGDPNYGSDLVVPDIMVGRLPAQTVADAVAIVAKLTRYEDLSGDVSWHRRAVLSADDAYSGETTFGGGGATSSSYCFKDYEQRFATLTDKMASIITRDAGLADFDPGVFDLRYYLESQTSGSHITVGGPGDTCRVNRSDTETYTQSAVTPLLFDQLNAGALIWNYQGHANEYVLTHENLYLNQGISGSSDDKGLFTNDDKPFIFTGFSCHANMFARPGAQLNQALGPPIGEDIVVLPSRGAVASWASVCFEVVPRDDSSHINVELIRSMFADPPRDASLGPAERGARTILGETILQSYLRYLPTVQTFGFERGLAVTYTLLGDPATRLSIGPPRQYVTANEVSVSDGQPVRLHSQTDTLTITADLVSTVRLDSLGLLVNTGSGDTPVGANDYTLTPAFPDTASGSLYGGRRFRLVYAAPLLAQTYHYTLLTRDRDGLSQRFTVLMELDGVLRSEGVAIQDGDQVSPTANLSLLLLCPRPVNPATDLTLTVNGQAQPFSATPANGDPSGREWVLSWTHAPYPIDQYEADLAIRNGDTIKRRFRVTNAAGTLAFRDLYAFPNPFAQEGTNFTFTLLGSDAADVRLSVWTQSGRVIYANVVRGLSPGYHQLAWDGRDAEGSDIANGVYLYRMSAVTPGGARAEQMGRLVKLRRPRHIADTTAP